MAHQVAGMDRGGRYHLVGIRVGDRPGQFLIVAALVARGTDAMASLPALVPTVDHSVDNAVSRLIVQAPKH